MAAFCLCAWATASLEARSPSLLSAAPRWQLYAAASGATERDPHPQAERPFQRLTAANDVLSAEYGYRNFNADSLRTRFSIPARELELYLQGYGYLQADLDDLRRWQVRAYNQAFRQARQQRLAQQHLDRMVEEIADEYYARYRQLLVARGFRLLSDNRFAPDIPQVVRRNVDELRDVALSLSRMAEALDYDARETVGAALSLVQTALRYADVPGEIDGRITAGLSPPLEVLARGVGDCDSKTALLASILLNWDQIRLVGVGVPNHYLMGILQNPAKGELFVEYQGLRYVLVEPAGPAWLPPGIIADYTQQQLEAGDEVSIEPLLARGSSLDLNELN